MTTDKDRMTRGTPVDPKQQIRQAFHEAILDAGTDANRGVPARIAKENEAHARKLLKSVKPKKR